MATDWFVAALRCPNCDEVTPEDGSTNMTTRIRGIREGAYLREGTPLPDVDASTIPHSGYLTLRTPRDGEPIRILQPWDCPNCGQENNWAEIIIDHGVIKSITAIELTREALDRAHFIAEQLEYQYEELTGEPLLQGMQPVSDFAQKLRVHLPDSCS